MGRLALLAARSLGTASAAAAFTTTAAAAAATATAATAATGVVFDTGAAPIGDVNPTAPLKLGQAHLE